MELEFSRQIFVKSSNIKFNQNPFIGSRDVPYGQADGQTDMTKLIVAFRKFANAPKNGLFESMKIKATVLHLCFLCHMFFL